MEELGNTVPAAEGLVDAENLSKESAATVCLNCGATLSGAYCSQCGQKNIPRRQTLGELVENFIGSFFSYESKFFRTVKFLLLKPGFLALEYTSGRRERYYHPARMYVFISFVYFLLFFSLPDGEDRNDVIQNDDVVLADSIDRVVDSASNKNNFKFGLTSEDFDSREAYDSAQATLPEPERDGWLMRKLQYRSIELQQEYRDDEKRFGNDFADSFGANSPKIFFFLLPVFALLLKLLYIRKDFYYSEHLVQSIYFYNFFFAIGSISMLIELVPGMSWIDDVTILVVFIYFLIAMKKMYGQSWRKTVVKFMILTIAFSFCIGIGLFVNLFFTLLFI